MTTRYGTQRVCLNGHQRSTDIQDTPPEPYCPECGEPTITNCQECKKAIRGFPYVEGVIALFETPVPKFCTECGKPFPWTQRQIESAIALLEESDSGAASDTEILRGALVAVSSDTPQTSLGVVRIKKIMGRVGKPIGDAIYKIAIDLATEAAKKALLGS